MDLSPQMKRTHLQFKTSMRSLNWSIWCHPVKYWLHYCTVNMTDSYIIGSRISQTEGANIKRGWQCIVWWFFFPKNCLKMKKLDLLFQIGPIWSWKASLSRWSSRKEPTVPADGLYAAELHLWTSVWGRKTWTSASELRHGIRVSSARFHDPRTPTINRIPSMFCLREWEMINYRPHT